MERVFDKNKVNKILYGGDYNPEQWDAVTREKDMELLKEAGVDILTLNVFSWATLQKDEDTYDFSELDAIVDEVSMNGFKICMATSTAAHPAWMAKKYPDVLRVDMDGRKRKFGFRHNSCPNSPTYRKYSPLLAKKIATRYKDKANIVAWHINNEYGGSCYCENCEKAFRIWLKERYGTLDKLNYAWNTKFWSHTFYDWDEIVAPNNLSEHVNGGRSCCDGITIDYKRFMSDSMMQNYIDESDAVKSVIPNAVVTTNFMEMFKDLDYKKWASHMDVVAWDSYPQKKTEPAYIAFNHDIMRGLKNGKPFMLMEQSPTVSSWLPVNSMKRPGQMKLLSYQAVAHGADTVMFFQMRQSPGSCEMYHGAIIDHSGRNDTRSFIECKNLGKELNGIGELTLGGRTKSNIAIIFDWESWWALEEASGINEYLKYPEEVMNYYRAFYEMNIPVDIIGYNDPIGGYDIVIAPLMYMIRDNIDKRLKDFVKNGGVLLTTLLSGMVSEDTRAILGGFPGDLIDATGVWNEEISMLYPDECNYFIYEGKRYEARLACSVLRLQGATSLCNYEEDYYRGMPVVTRHGYGAGMVYYVGTTSEADFYRHLIKNICLNSNIKDSTDSDILAQSANRASTLEITYRESNAGKLLYVMNHSDEHETICFTEDCKDLITGMIYRMGEQIHVNPKDVFIMKKVQ